MKKKPTPAKQFRIRFETADQVLVMDQPVKDESAWLFKVEGYRKEADVLKILDIDAREKGVRIVKLTLTDDGVHAIVAWL